MTARLFAIARTLIVGTAFVSLWTWFLPRWIAGAGAFATHPNVGWIVIAIPGAAIVHRCAL